MNVEKLRADFPVLERKVHGKPLVYLDSTATSLKPQCVIDAERAYYEKYSANIHRGLHTLSEEASRAYENAHKDVAKLVGAKMEEVAFVKNATEGMNALAYTLWTSGKLQKGDKVVVSKLEHHANLVPWQFLERKAGIALEFAELDGEYRIDLEDLERKVDERTKLVSIAHASNTVGAIVDAKRAGQIAKKKGALFALDAAQSTPHMETNFNKLGADFAVFSGHKMLGPTGIGAWWARREHFEALEPFLYGGDMIQEVTWHDAKWNALPYKFEAGTPAIAQGIGFGEAARYLSKLGLGDVRAHEVEITKYALSRMGEIKGIRTYGPSDAKERGGVVVFDHEKLEAHDLALALDELGGVAIRSGMHCAEPLVSAINPKGLARASFYVYTTKSDIDAFVDTLEKATGALA